MKKFATSVLLAITSISCASAQMNIQSTGGVSSQGGQTLLNLLSFAQIVVNRLVPFLIGLALVVFFWYLIKFIIKGNQSPDAHNQALKGMGMSILALFVMVSIWGIVAFLANLLGVTPNASVLPPVVPGPTPSFLNFE